MSLHRHDKGMTLLELIVVVGMLGLGFGLVFLKMDNMLPGQRLVSDARAIASLLEQARNHAIVSGWQVNFEYNLDENTYRMFHPFEISDDGKSIAGEGESPLYEPQELNDTIEIADVLIGDGDVVNRGQVVVTFEPRGIATGHAVHIVKEETDYFYTILVSPLLGYVEIIKGYQEPEVLPDER